MSADALMERLKMMMESHTPKSEAKAANGKPKAKAKAEPAPVPAPVVDEDEEEDEELVGGPTPVVVLDDHETFSNLANCKICFVQPDCDEIDADHLASGISIEDLLTLHNAITALRKILG